MGELTLAGRGARAQVRDRHRRYRREATLAAQIQKSADKTMAAVSVVITVIGHAETYIQWYDRHADRNARVSRACRLLAVFFGILGGKCPLLPVTILEMIGFHNPASADATKKSFGFVFFACAAGLMLLDNLLWFFFVLDAL